MAKSLGKAKNVLLRHAVNSSERVHGKISLSHVLNRLMSPDYRQHAGEMLAIVREQERDRADIELEMLTLEAENSALKADFDANLCYNSSNSQRIAAAIREMQLMDDPNDPQKYFFWRKYQWRAVFDAMCHYRLLPNLYDDDKGKAAFCDICDDQDHSLHFLPADHHEIGDWRGRYNRSSVYHQMTNSKPDDPRAKYYEIYDATYAEFEKLLLSHGAIDCII